MIVAARMLRDRRRSLLWWSAGIVGLVLFTVALYPTVERQESFEELADQLPEAMRSLFGFDGAVPLTSAPGYLHSRLFAGLLPLVLGLVGASAGVFGLALLHASVSFTVGDATGGRAWALAAATTLAVAGYLLQGLLGLSEAVQPLRLISPWHWYLGRNMLAEGVAPDAIIVSLVLAAGLCAVGALAFERRDLR